MREFELVIDEALKNGLSPLRTTPFNTQLLKECLGFRCGELGLERYRYKSNPLPSYLDIEYSWPFPQYITGEKYNLLVIRDIYAAADIVYSISDDHTNIEHVGTYSHASFGVGSLMEVADFGKYVLMVNGAVMIHKDANGNWEIVPSVLGMPMDFYIPMLKTVCNFKGQAVGGAIVNVEVTPPPTYPPCSVPPTTMMPVKAPPPGTYHYYNWESDEILYVWSKIGDIDFTVDEYNLAGFKRDPFGGVIHHTRRLEDVVIGYSSKGITMLYPVDSPAPTFGFKELSDIGIINQGALNGDLYRHIYVGEDYILREVTTKGVKKLGYENQMRELSGEDIIISYDKSLGDFYIGNSSKTFLLSSHGMTEIPQHPSCVWRSNGETHMLPDTVDDYEPLIATHPFDMGYSGMKTLFEMETDLTMSEKPSVAADYYLSPTNYGTTPYIPLNNQNAATIIVSGNAFAFKLKAEYLEEDARISYIKARYKMTDLRSLRGVYAPPPRGQ